MTNDQQRSRMLEQDLARLVPIARRKATSAGRQGITVENVRRGAENAGLLLASSDRGYLGRLFGAVMVRAGLERVKGRYVRTKRQGKKSGNLVAVWRRAA